MNWNHTVHISVWSADKGKFKEDEGTGTVLIYLYMSGNDAIATVTRHSTLEGYDWHYIPLNNLLIDAREWNMGGTVTVHHTLYKPF